MVVERLKPWRSTKLFFGKNWVDWSLVEIFKLSKSMISCLIYREVQAATTQAIHGFYTLSKTVRRDFGFRFFIQKNRWNVDELRLELGSCSDQRLIGVSKYKFYLSLNPLRIVNWFLLLKKKNKLVWTVAKTRSLVIFKGAAPVKILVRESHARFGLQNFWERMDGLKDCTWTVKNNKCTGNQAPWSE